MRIILSVVSCFVLLATTCKSFVLKTDSSRVQSMAFMTQQQNDEFSNVNNMNRRQLLKHVSIASSSIASIASIQVSKAFADVSDGNSLPQGAQQFASIIRLKSDLIAVKKRLLEGGAEIDKKEWDNINKFLRTIYSTAENDMKFVAKGIYDTDKKKIALNSSEQLKKYAQAGDVSVSKQNYESLATILDKCSGLVDEFLDALSDVPDEL